MSDEEKETLHKIISSEKLANNDNRIKEIDSKPSNENQLISETSNDVLQKRKSRKTLLWIICACVLVATLVVIVTITIINSSKAALSSETETMFEYSEIDDLIYITKYVGKEENVIVPAIIDGKSIFEISYGTFFNNRIIKSVKISNGIKKLGFSIFENCSNLEYIEIPDSVFISEIDLQ